VTVSPRLLAKDVVPFVNVTAEFVSEVLGTLASAITPVLLSNVTPVVVVALRAALARASVNNRLVFPSVSSSLFVASPCTVAPVKLTVPVKVLSPLIV